MRTRQRELDRLRSEGLSNESRHVLTETLNVVGLQWLYQTELFQRMSASIDPNILFFNYHRFGRMSQEEGFYIDVPLQTFVSMNRTGTFIPGNPAIFGSSFFGSAMEHGVLQQTQGAENGAVSTIKMLETAIRTGGRVFYADGANYETGDNIRSKLTGYQTATLNSFSSIFNNANNFAVLPQQGNYQIDDWTGTAYMQIQSSTIGMIINGSYGGYSTNFGNISTPTTVNRNIAAPNYYTANPPTMINPRSWDPVDMATGAFLLDTADLSIGGGALPQGISFQRHYNSQRNADDTPGLGYGWTHNLHGRVTIRSAVDAGLGETTPAEAAPLLLAAAVVRDLIANRESRSAREWTVAALVTDWATDQLLDNAASVSIGDRTLQFIRMPDGSYVSPAGVSATLEHDSNGTFTLAERFGNTYHFADAADNHRLVKITDPFGLEADFSYHTDGRLQQVEDAYGRTLTLNYTNARVTSVSDSTGRSLTFTYDSHGNLTTATDPEGKSTTYHYHDTNTGPTFAEKRLMVAIELPDNRVSIRNFYDSQNRVIEQHGDDNPDRLYQLYFNGRENIEEDPHGGRVSYFFSEKFRDLGTADALGNRTTKAYDGQDNLVAQTSPGQGEVTSEYDAHQNPVRQNLPGNLEQLHTYDTLHRPTESRVRDLTNTHPDRVTSFHYASGNDTHLPDSITDPEGNVTEFTYHPDGQVHTETAVSTSGNRTTTYQYGPRGMPILITYPDSTTESFTYNQRGDLLTETDRRGHTTSYQYNDRRELTHITAPDGGITIRTFDDNGNLETVTDPEGNVTRQTWSPQKKLLTVTTAYGTPEAATTTHEYDERDWRVRTIDPLGRTVHFEHDAAGRVIKITDPLGRETHFTFDADGNRTSVTTPEGILTQHGYNERGEQITMTDPADNSVTYTHNAFGEQTGLENRRGHSYTFSYNKNGQPLTLSTPLGHTTTTNYNDLGEATSIVKPSGQTTTFTHDNMGRVATQTDDVGTITFAYDNADNPLTITEGAAVLTRAFDNMDRVTSYTDASGNTVQYEWDQNSRLTQITYPDNKTVTYTYDNHNRLKTVTDWSNRVTTYHWDAAGRLIGIDRHNGTTRTNEYTAGDELDRYYERNGAGVLQAYARFGYDLDSRIDWRYRLPKPQAMTLPTFAATHDADNRIVTWNSQSVTHDNDGNMTFGPLPGNESFVNFVFDARNRLQSSTGFQPVSYQYDAENNKISKTTSDGTTTYVFDPHGDALPRVLVRERPDESLTYYVYGIGLLYEVDEQDDPTYYHFDQSGSTIALTDSSGEVTDRVEYTPYGTISHRMGTTNTPYLYVGQFGIQTEPNGLLHMRARYYSPELKRFINADPAGFGGGMNWYAYANNSPLMYVDPDGETPVTIMIGMVVGGVAGGLMSAFDGDPHTSFMGGFISGAITGGLTGSGVGLLGRAAFTTVRGASTAGFFGFGGGVIGNTTGQGWNNWRSGYNFNQNMARISSRTQLTAGVSNAFSTVTFGAASAGLSHYSNRLIDAGLNRGSNYVSGLASTGILGRNQLNAASNNLMNPLLRIEAATRSITGGGSIRNDFTSSIFSTGYGTAINSSFSNGRTIGGGFK
ncbi:MAG: DUF6531 domain-containing protein [Opitutales bacterium]|nr:DUF6531 domain-containing protein [Opitutales bacterium]